MNSKALILGLIGLLLACAARTEPPKAVSIEPCRTAGQKSGPVTEECQAAAIAEDAFLRETQQRIVKYWISPMRHTADRWKFVIFSGDRQAPAAPGGEFMVSVSRATGEVEVTAGK